tara:strand:+ start:218 stop:1444 length:1227 start_codon:yes stop_codon:yes gene_type:complete
MALNKAQKVVAASDARFRVLVAGRRLGKTFLSVRELARFARQPNKKILYICPTYQMARDIIWADLKARLQALNWVKKTNESRLELTLVNNSKISLRSGDNPDSLRGGGYDFCVFDETADIKPELWYEVIRPALSAQNPPGSALFCGTPRGGNWFKDLYDLGKGQDPDWASYQYTTLDGGQVPESEIEAAKRDLDERTFRQEYEATFESFSGVIAYNFSDANVKSIDIPFPAKQLIVGMDFNGSPMTCVVMIQTPNGLHAFDEIRMLGSNTDEMCQEIKNRYPSSQIIVFPDNSGAQLKTSAGGRTDISILQNAGFVVKSKSKNPPVRDRINAMNSMLKSVSGDHKYTVDRKCKYLIQSLERYAYKPDTQTPDKSGYDHMFDAATYAVEYLYPVKRAIKPDNMKTFGVY